jgi:REP element-mobilizing transposase RayT
MPQTFSATFLHLVFSTKERRPFLSDSTIRRDMHSYIAGVSARLDCPALVVGGVADHVHLLARFGTDIKQQEWVKELKRLSSLWIKQRDPSYRDFYWQTVYGVFSVSASNVERVRVYIQRQEEHHRKASFQDEFRGLLRKHGLVWDERYVWD